MYNSKVEILSQKFNKECYVNVISKLPEQFSKISGGQFLSFRPLIKINPFLISVVNIFLIDFTRVSFKQYLIEIHMFKVISPQIKGYFKKNKTFKFEYVPLLLSLDSLFGETQLLNYSYVHTIQR